MADITVKKLNEFESKYNGGMSLVRHGLGVTSFGLQVEQLPPNMDQYPEHDHSHDGQEEVYAVVDGSATLKVGDEEHELEAGTWARVGPGETRKIVTGEEGATIIALGGTPGKAYEVPEFSLPDAS